jgi:hypothetical protein
MGWAVIAVMTNSVAGKTFSFSFFFDSVIDEARDL